MPLEITFLSDADLTAREGAHVWVELGMRGHVFLKQHHLVESLVASMVRCSVLAFDQVFVPLRIRLPKIEQLELCAHLVVVNEAQEAL